MYISLLSQKWPCFHCNTIITYILYTEISLYNTSLIYPKKQHYTLPTCSHLYAKCTAKTTLLSWEQVYRKMLIVILTSVISANIWSITYCENSLKSSALPSLHTTLFWMSIPFFFNYKKLKLSVKTQRINPVRKHIYLPWIVTLDIFLTRIIFHHAHYYNCVKFHQYQFICLGGVGLREIMTDKLTYRLCILWEILLVQLYLWA